MEQVPYRTALITGASSGIGRQLAKWFALRGVRVFAAARRKEHLDALAEEVARGGGTLVPVPLDVTEVREVLERIRGLDEESGGLELVIANAGVGGETPARAPRWDRIQKIIDVNVTGAAATLTAVLPKMVERDRGHLVGIASIASYRGMPGASAYSASKAFLTTYLESLRVDLQRTGVRVTTVHPGFIKSELTAKNKFKMPFLLETEPAADQLARAILRGESEYAFPWQLASVAKLGKLLPNRLWNVAARKLR